MLGGQIFVDKAGPRLDRLPSISTVTPRASPRKSFLAHAQPLTPMFSDTSVWCALTLVLCVLLFMAYTGTHGGSQGATVLGKRSWKDLDLTMSQRLEMQLESKQEEIDALKLKISRIMASNRMAESNMASQESLIRTLQARQEAEKAAKYKALYALAEHTKTLDECTRQHQLLESELAMCQRDLGAMDTA